MIGSIASYRPLLAAPPPAPAPPAPGPLYCTPEIRDQISGLIGQAEAANDSGTFAYGMGFCVGAMAGLAVGGAVHPALGVLSGAAVFAGGIYLGRKADQEARAYVQQARELNDKYRCFDKF